MLATLLLAALLVLFSWLLESNNEDGTFAAFFGGFLGDSGAALMLVFPAALLERFYDRRLQSIDHKVEEAQQTSERNAEEFRRSITDFDRRLRELDADTSEAVRDARNADHEQALSSIDALADGRFADVFRTLDRAFAQRATGLDVFVPVREAGVTLGFGARSVPNKIAVAVHPIGDRTDRYPLLIDWTPDQDYTAFFVELDRARRARYGRAKSPEIPPGAALEHLKRTLELAFVRQEDAGERAPRQYVVELATARWLVTNKGLEDLDDSDGWTFSWDMLLQPPPDGLTRVGSDELEDFRFAWLEARSRLGQFSG